MVDSLAHTSAKVWYSWT